MNMETTTLKRNVWTFPGLGATLQVRIREMICYHFDLTYEELISERRFIKWVYARHLYRYLLSLALKEGAIDSGNRRENCLYTLDEIADMTGCIDHSGVVPSIRTAQNLITTDKVYRDKFLLIINSLDKNQLAL